MIKFRMVVYTIKNIISLMMSMEKGLKWKLSWATVLSEITSDKLGHYFGSCPFISLTICLSLKIFDFFSSSQQGRRVLFWKRGSPAIS